MGLRSGYGTLNGSYDHILLAVTYTSLRSFFTFVPSFLYLLTTFPTQIKKNRIRDDQNLIDSENLQNRYILPPLTKKQMRNLGKLTKEQRHEFFLDRDEPFDRIKHKVFKAEVDKKRKSGEYKEAIYPPPDGHDIEYEEYTDEELFHYSVIMQKETGFSASY